MCIRDSLDSQSASAAAEAAVTAAQEGLAAVQALNEAAPSEPSGEVSWRPLDMGIALHRGPVFFGNIGSKDRLDFTVIGPAVNLAARVEPISKETGRRLLLTEKVAEVLDRRFEHLGEFRIRGLADPIPLFSPD